MDPYKFNVLTVMHTGTRFLNEYLKLCGMIFPMNYPINDRAQYRANTAYAINHLTSVWDASNAHLMAANRIGYPTVSILRDPLLSALSWLERDRQKYPITECVKSWDQLIKYASRKKVVFFDIDCPIEFRASHLLNITKQLGFYEESLIDITNAYAAAWKPVGATHSLHKAAYLQDGTLPDVYNWDQFERATKWYKMKLQECVY